MSEPAAPAPAEPPQRELRDAADVRRLPSIDLAAETAAQRKQLALLQRAIRLAETDLAKAVDVTEKALALDGFNAKAQHVMGLLKDKQGLVSEALEHYEAAWRLDPEDSEIYQNLGLAAWKLDMLEGAERFFRIACQKEPGRYECIINLAGTLRDQAKFDDAIEILRQAIYLDQTNPWLWNTLGSVLLESGDPFQAETFYREAISLAPDNARAWHNLGYALDLRGELDGALEAFDTALGKNLPEEDNGTIRHGRSFTLLSLGRLEEGWDAYGVRMSRAYKHATVFVINANRWDRDPESLKGKRVLLVGEQGVGDEVLFMNAAEDLNRAIGPDGTLMIACEKRLIPLIERAFPDAVVGHHYTFAAEARKFRTAPWVEEAGGCDMWTPMGDPVCVFRRSIDAFPAQTVFLPADPKRVEDMKAQLDALGPGLKVGIVWKSMLMTPSRAKYFSPFDQWAPVLKTPGVTFVNLQYGDVSAELEKVRREHGVTVHQIEGLDVKDDLDGVAALGAALDLSIGPMTASINLAATAGGEVWVLGYRTQWTSLGTDRLPFYPTARMMCPPGWGQWDPAMKKVAAALAERAGNRAGAAEAAA